MNSETAHNIKLTHQLNETKIISNTKLNTQYTAVASINLKEHHSVLKLLITYTTLNK